MDNKEPILYFDKEQNRCFLYEAAAKKMNIDSDTRFGIYKNGKTITLKQDLNESSVLYHYCSLSTLLSIIKNKCLWLTNPMKSNDSEEIIWATRKLDEGFLKTIEFIKNASELDLQNFINSLITQGSLPSSDAEQIKKNIQNKSLDKIKLMILKNLGSNSTYLHQELRKTLSILYITCFSEGEDKLSQWRGYGDDGKGVAIGFSVKTLGELEEGIENLNISKVLYHNEDQEALLNKALLQFLKDPITIEQWAHQILPVMKPIGFHEEEECRFIYLPKKGKEELIYKNVEKNGELRFYYELPILLNSISEITIGPKSKIEPIELCYIMRKEGFMIDEEQINKSTLSYR